MARCVTITFYLLLLCIQNGVVRAQIDGSFWWLQGPLANENATKTHNDNYDSAEGDNEYSAELNEDSEGDFSVTQSDRHDSGRDSDFTTIRTAVDDRLDHCECVFYYLCDQFDNVVTDGSGIIDPRKYVRSTKKQCPNPLHRCCNVHNKENSILPGNTTSGHVIQRPFPLRPIPTLPLTTHKPAPEIHVPFACGTRAPQLNNRIQDVEGDSRTKFGEFPWMLALLKNSPDGLQFHCGASLIHPRVAVTAGHCVGGKSPLDLVIRAGDWDSSSDRITEFEPLPFADRQVSILARHPQYYSGALYNDLAVLIWNEPLDLADNIRTICLPHAGQTFDGTRCTATGWGKAEYVLTGSLYQPILRKVTIPIVSRETCQGKLRKTRLGGHFMLHSSFVCAGGEPGQDTCQGDGGGPLACLDPATGRYILGGIVSWGLKCGESLPALYTNIGLLGDWIRELMYIHGIV